MRSVAFGSINANMVFSGSWDKKIKIWSLDKGKNKKTLYGHTADIFTVTNSPSGNFLITGSADRILCIWMIQNGKIVR